MISLPAIQAHKIWAPFYDSTPNPLLALERRTLRELLGEREAGNVIDIACGTGQWSDRLRHTGANVIGLDACVPMLQEARKRTALCGRLVQGDARSLPFAGGWADLVLCSMSLGYFEHLDAVFAEFSRVARCGASIVITDLHPEAIAAGWTRSFKVGGLSCEIQHFFYSTDQIAEAARHGGLLLSQWSQARLGWPEFPLFEESGKSHLFQASMGRPALLLAVWEKP